VCVCVCGCVAEWLTTTEPGAGERVPIWRDVLASWVQCSTG
jgi:hypothetical protein